MIIAQFLKRVRLEIITQVNIEEKCACAPVYFIYASVGTCVCSYVTPLN